MLIFTPAAVWLSVEKNADLTQSIHQLVLYGVSLRHLRSYRCTVKNRRWLGANFERALQEGKESGDRVLQFTSMRVINPLKPPSQLVVITSFHLMDS